MGLTFIYGDVSSSRPKRIEVNSRSSKLETGKLSNTQVKNIIMIYAHGGVYSNTQNSFISLSDTEGKNRRHCRAAKLTEYLEEIFKDINSTAKNKVKEIHLLSCNSAYTSDSVSLAQNLADNSASNIVSLFPNIEKVVGIEYVLDIRTSGEIYTGEYSLGTISDITNSGLPDSHTVTYEIQS